VEAYKDIVNIDTELLSGQPVFTGTRVPGGIYPFYPYCISCGCAIVQIDEAAEKIDVTDPRPFGNYCPPQGN